MFQLVIYLCLATAPDQCVLAERGPTLTHQACEASAFAKLNSMPRVKDHTYYGSCRVVKGNDA